MKKIIGVATIVVAIGAVVYGMHINNASITGALDSEPIAASTSTLESALSKKEAQVRDFEEKYAKQLSSAIKDVAFSGDEPDKAVSNLIAPGTLTQVIDGGFVVRTPDISEDEIRAAAVIERLEYTLGNLEPEVLDAMMVEYLDNPEAMLSDMGLVQRCNNGVCGYQIQDGPFLQAVAQAGVQQSDTILTINNVSIGDISDYSSFKTVVFSNVDVIQMAIDRAGDVMTVDIPVSKAPVEGVVSP
ncbi:hypothetical protein A9Q81_24830 [Gammaproteobacteria bacterium 42_54_T18]|nr:hypothetical protein A9Q81_24830 [Gammaproteobacteria bacterium 42_54_T18]